MSDADKDQGNTPSKFAIIGATVCAALLLALMVFVAAEYLLNFSPSTDPLFVNLLKDHFRAIVGGPLAAIGAFLIVVFLRQTSGPIEFEGLGFKFKGASGQVMMWAICFAFLVAGIRLLW